MIMEKNTKVDNYVLESSSQLRPKIERSVALTPPGHSDLESDGLLMILQFEKVFHDTQIPSLFKPANGDGRAKYRALSDSPSSHSCPTPCIGLALVNA